MTDILPLGELVSCEIAAPVMPADAPALEPERAIASLSWQRGARVGPRPPHRRPPRDQTVGMPHHRRSAPTRRTDPAEAPLPGAGLGAPVEVHLVDGTYELFRHFYGQPPRAAEDGTEVGATRGVVRSVLSLLANGATHVGVATDHVIESFRNRLWPGYKTGEGVDTRLRAQFDLLEMALETLGVTVWATVELEADDALASAAVVCSEDPQVARVVLCSPDKDLAQCVTGGRVVRLDRRTGTVLDEAGVISTFGVPPASIPDWLALVGDAADGFPGLAGWGRVSASAVLSHYGHLESVPTHAADWEPNLRRQVRGAAAKAKVLAEQMDLALLFRDLATLRVDRSLLDTAEDLRWRGPATGLEDLCTALGDPGLAARVTELAEDR